MDILCQNCWNEDCKAQGEEFMLEKLVVCKEMLEHPEMFDWDEDLYPWH